MKKHLLISLIIGFMAAWLNYTPALADGWIIPDPPPPPCEGCRPPVPPDKAPYLAVKYHRVTVKIKDQIATTHIDQVFLNNSKWSLQGTYVFPLPEEAAINNFTMWVDGRPQQGKLYTREEARQIYEGIVRRRMDPALLEYVGRDLFQASIFPIPPGEERRVEIEYSQALAADNGLIHYVYPLSTEKFSSAPLEDVSVSVEIDSKEAIKSVYSPSHTVSVDRVGDYTARLGWEAHQVTPNTDFSLYYSVSPQELGVNLLSYKAGGEDGFFTLLIAPNIEAAAGRVVTKDVDLILDTSGSMEGEKLEQAKTALNYVLDHLNEGDRFNIFAFSTAVHAFADRPQGAASRAEARRFVDDLRAEGSTDINRALLEALNSADKERPTIFIFLTDGLPTQGVVDTPAILANIQNAAPKNVRIFPFGVGDDVDTVLLDTLAREQRGASAYVRPGDRVDEQVSGFYAKVSTPVLADTQIRLDGAQVEELYPYPLPDIFAGSQLVVVGRYRDGGPVTVELTGMLNGEEQKLRYQDLSLKKQGGDDFIPRLWATRKIGYLLNEIRLRGEKAELIDQIVKLSIRYGVITPYTSFLVQETDKALSEEGREDIVQQEYKAAQAAPTEAPSGAQAVNKAQEQAGLERAQQAAPPPAASGESSNGAPAVAAVGEKAFVYKDGLWIDTTFDSGKMKAVEITVGSPEFFKLLEQYPQAGKYFAVGERVIVVLGGQAYQSRPGEAQAATASAAGGSEGSRVSSPASYITEDTSSSPVDGANSETAPAPFCRGLFGALFMPLLGLLLKWK